MDLMVVNKSEHDLVALCTIAHSLNIDAKRKRPKSCGSALVGSGWWPSSLRAAVRRQRAATPRRHAPLQYELVPLHGCQWVCGLAWLWIGQGRKEDQ